MKFQFETGFVITAIAALLFYFRVAMIRGKKRRLAKEDLANIMAMPKGKKQKDMIREQEQKRNVPSIEVSSWIVVGLAILLMLAGVVVKNTPDLNLPQIVKDYWWIGTAGGFVLFIFGFK
ncbi:MAG: hypothetical protein ACYDH1_06680 [Anaerolineaceae bacterium]